MEKAIDLMMSFAAKRQHHGLSNPGRHTLWLSQSWTLDMHKISVVLLEALRAYHPVVSSTKYWSQLSISGTSCLDARFMK